MVGDLWEVRVVALDVLSELTIIAKLRPLEVPAIEAHDFACVRGLEVGIEDSLLFETGIADAARVLCRMYMYRTAGAPARDIE